MILNQKVISPEIIKPFFASHIYVYNLTFIDVTLRAKFEKRTRAAVLNVIMNHSKKKKFVGRRIHFYCVFRISLIRTDDECLSSHNIEKNVYRQVTLFFRSLFCPRALSLTLSLWMYEKQ